MQLLTIEQLAELLHKTPSSIRTDRVRKPDSLPPSFTLPGSRKVLYKSDAVNDWLNALATAQNPAKALVHEVIVTGRGRGRPTIASQLRK